MKTKKDDQSVKGRSLLHGRFFFYIYLFYVRCFAFCCFCNKLAAWVLFALIALRQSSGDILRSVAHTKHRCLKLFMRPILVDIPIVCFHYVFVRRRSTGASQHGKLRAAVRDHRRHCTHISPPRHEEV